MLGIVENMSYFTPPDLPDRKYYLFGEGGGKRVADRVGIIRTGHLIAVEGVQELRSKAMRRVDLYFDGPADASVFASVPGASDIEARNHHVSMSFNGSMEQLLGAASSQRLTDITTQEADLEEIFLTYYREEV